MLSVRILKIVLLFLSIWLFIPWITGIGFKKIGINYPYDLVVANEFIIMVSSLTFTMLGKEKNVLSFTISTSLFFRVIFLTLILQAITLAGIVVLIVYSAPLPNFIYTDSLITIFIKYVIFIPLCEEIFIRLLIQPRLSFLKGTIKIRSIQLSNSVVFTAFLFGVMHLVPFYDLLSAIKTFLSVFILGLIAGHYREITGSLLPAYIAHAAYNFWGGFLSKVIYLIFR